MELCVLVIFPGHGFSCKYQYHYYGQTVKQKGQEQFFPGLRRWHFLHPRTEQVGYSFLEGGYQVHDLHNLEGVNNVSRIAKIYS